MNRKFLVLFLATALAMSALSIGTAAAKTTTQNIEFTLNGWADSYDPITQTWSNVPTSAVFAGNFQDKDGAIYLKPLTGTITIDEDDYQIQIKQPKQSEPVYYYEDSDLFYIDDCHYFQVEWQSWLTFSEVNIEGHKYIGDLNWHQNSMLGIWGCEPIYDFYGESNLSFRGIIDGKRMNFWLNGASPVIS